VDRLRFEKHFINVLFRLLGVVSTRHFYRNDSNTSAARFAASGFEKLRAA
jgi:hypothetical protein